jgi:hypothetical protein
MGIDLFKLDMPKEKKRKTMAWNIHGRKSTMSVPNLK